jgi:tRNA (cmo5U34)-methyltransferase
MGMTTDTYFDSTAREYDDRALRAMPRYEEMLAQIAFASPPGAGNILELGCGTGALTGIVAERYPKADLVAVDASGQMIQVAKERLRRSALFSGRIEFRTAAFEELTLEPGCYDLVVSNMALHHIVEKQPFYTQIRGALRPQGLLVLGDELQGAMPAVERRHYDAWLEFARRPGGLSAEELHDIIRHDELYDHYETLPKQLELLVAAGFGAVDCTWRYLNYGVFVAAA